jgi:hypothetical protein
VFDDYAGCSRLKKHLIPELLLDELSVTVTVLDRPAFRITDTERYLETNMQVCIPLVPQKAKGKKGAQAQPE